MRRRGGQTWTLAAAVALWLTGCASVGDLSAGTDPLLTTLAERLDRDDWRVDLRWSASGDDKAWRWELGGLPVPSADAPPRIDDLLTEWERRDAKARGDHPLLQLSRRPGRVGRNATVLLARLDVRPDEATERLAGLVTGEAIESREAKGLASLLSRLRGDGEQATNEDRPPAAARAAAAEAWCRGLAAGDGPLEDRLAAPGRAWTRADLPDLVRGELLRGLARHLPPERIVGCGELFVGGPAAPAAELRRAAIEGCVLFAAGHPGRPFAADDWPGAIESARFDIDPTVRRGYGRWAALAGHPDAVPILEAQLQDTDVETAVAAIESLGLIRTDAARDSLRVVAAKPAETLRVAAAGALAAWGPAEVKPLMADESAHVRRAAVASLGRCPSPEAAVLLDSVIADSDLDVQRRAVFATTEWPDGFALPVLLAGLSDASLRTRRDALEELRRRTGYADSFPVTGDAAEREATVREAAKKHDWPLDSLTRFRLAKSAGDGAAPASPAEAALILARLNGSNLSASDQSAFLAKLREMGPAAVPAIEAFCVDAPGPTADRLIAEVLPAIDPTHAAAAELSSEDVTLRRRGAGRLAEHGRAASLSPLLLGRLRERLTREQDGLVWRQAMAAIAADATPEAERIALLALNNVWPDVRRLGCEYVGRHGRAGHAEWLLPLLSDQNDSVRLAAIDALGRCGGAAGLDSADRLRTAAAGSDQAARFAALAALARVGDESGTAALLRWAEYEAPAERAKAVRAIAATGRRRFEPDLARLAWTERDPLVRRELLEALEALVPPGSRPAGADAGSTDDRVEAWASRRGGPVSTMSPPDAGPRPAPTGQDPEPPHDR